MMVLHDPAPFAIALGETGAAVAADVKLISPPEAQIVGPYSPGLLAGELPPTIAGQVRQTYENIRSIVTAAGLSTDHIAYSQIYLTGNGDFVAARAAWLENFRDGGLALAMLGITRTPGDAPVEINAVVVTHLTMNKAARLPGTSDSGPPDAVIAGDRLFFSDCSGHGESSSVPADSEAETQAALARIGKVLAAAGIGFDNVVFVNPYLTGGMSAEVMSRVYAKHFKFGDTPTRATIHVTRPPKGANLTFTGVAAMDTVARRSVRPKKLPASPTASPCVFVTDTLYCSAESAFIPGPNPGASIDRGSTGAQCPPAERKANEKRTMADPRADLAHRGEVGIPC
jgi:2-iminobutanoate/2-iminopropanoate deaminase